MAASNFTGFGVIYPSELFPFFGFEQPNVV